MQLEACIANSFRHLPWIQNVAELRRNDRIGKVSELNEPHFYVAMAMTWNAIATLEQFYHAAAETEIATLD